MAHFTIAPALPAEVEAAEERYTAYLRQHYGPLWGHDNEAEADRLAAELTAAYDAAGIDHIDRLNP